MPRLVPQMAVAVGALMVSACFPPIDPPTPPDAGEPPSFEDRFVGLWLYGSGTQRDWMRVMPLDGDSGEVLFKGLEPVGEFLPGYGCDGTGSWELLPDVVDGVQLTYPDGCVSSVDSAQVFFIINPAPLGKSLRDKIVFDGSSEQLDAFRFPETWCEPDMSSCEDPI